MLRYPTRLPGKVADGDLCGGGEQFMACMDDFAKFDGVHASVGTAVHATFRVGKHTALDRGVLVGVRANFVGPSWSKQTDAGRPDSAWQFAERRCRQRST